MMKAEFYVGITDDNEDAIEVALKFFTKNFGGATVIRSRGTDDGGDPEDSAVFITMLDDTAAETRARMVADELLDMFHDQDRVMFFLSYGLTTFVSRPHINSDDADRVVHPRQSGGNHNA